MDTTHLETNHVENTPTWAVVTTCSVFVLLSLAFERSLHYLGKFLKRRRHPELRKALDKTKDELMLLGFISLLLIVFQKYITHFCIQTSVATFMLPCNSSKRQISNNSSSIEHETTTHVCPTGKVPLLESETLEELHTLIFVLAVVQVVFTATTVCLARCKILSWRVWEEEILMKAETNCLKNTDSLYDLTQTYRPVKLDEFIKDHATRPWSNVAILRWLKCFLRQFGSCVTRLDYQTLRWGFINAHLGCYEKYNFHAFLMRSLEDDCKKIVGIRLYHWLFAMLFLLFDIYDRHIYFSLEFLPLILLIVVGIKLELIITTLAQDYARHHKIVKGEIAVRLKNDLFWWNNPKFLLHMIHYILFHNALQMSFLIWSLASYGLDFCFNGDILNVMFRFFIGALAQFLMSYVTLPLYALVNQMGDRWTKTIFSEHVKLAIEQWSYKAKENTKLKNLVIER